MQKYLKPWRARLIPGTLVGSPRVISVRTKLSGAEGEEGTQVSSRPSLTCHLWIRVSLSPEREGSSYLGMLPPTEVEKPSVSPASPLGSLADRKVSRKRSPPLQKKQFFVRTGGERERGTTEKDLPRNKARALPSPKCGSEAEGQPVDSDEPKAFTTETGKRKEAEPQKICVDVPMGPAASPSAQSASHFVACPKALSAPLSPGREDRAVRRSTALAC